MSQKTLERGLALLYFIAAVITFVVGVEAVAFTCFVFKALLAIL